jgi:hypothetical protein
MNRFLALSGQRMNIDHMAMIFRPAGKQMTHIATNVPISLNVSVRETPEVILRALEKAGAAREFIQITSGNIGGGKLLVATRHLAAYGKQQVGSGSVLIFAIDGMGPEPARETPEEIDALVEAASMPFSVSV